MNLTFCIFMYIMGPAISYYNKRLILLSEITFSGGYCTIQQSTSNTLYLGFVFERKRRKFFSKFVYFDPECII